MKQDNTYIQVTSCNTRDRIVQYYNNMSLLVNPVSSILISKLNMLISILVQPSFTAVFSKYFFFQCKTTLHFDHAKNSHAGRFVLVCLKESDHL